MGDKWHKVDRGIRYREHPTRKHGIGPDKYYVLRFTVNGKKIQESLGWASDGITLEKARIELSKLKEASRLGEGPLTLAEKRQQATSRREAEALRKEQEQKEAISLGNYYEQQYKPWANSTKKSAFRPEDSHWRTWIAPLLANIPLRDIKLEHWDKLVQTLSAGGVTERTRQYVAGTLRRILSHARAREIFKETLPTGKIIGATAPKNNRRIRVLEDDDLQELLSRLKIVDIHAWRITLFAALTGCRLGEAGAMTWRDVKLDEQRVTFPKTKGGTSRTIPIGEHLVAMLRTIPKGKPFEKVFLNPLGKPYSDAPASFRSVVQALGLNEGRSKLDRFTFHSLRHGAATTFAKRMTLRDLMDYMGWKVAAMALRYTHSNEASQRAAIVDFEQQVLGAPK